MTTAILPGATEHRSLADLVERLGNIPLARIRLQPPLGTATEDDLLGAGKPDCELIDGVLVEQAVGHFESRLGFILGVIIEEWLAANPIGYVVGEGALTRMEAGIVRAPDVSFVRWERVADQRIPRDPVSPIAPSLAVEILSRANTQKEMERKRHEYFAAGIELVWIVEPELMTVEVWSSSKDCHILDRKDSLDGGVVLPGFQLSIQEWFRRAEGIPREKTQP